MFTGGELAMMLAESLWNWFVGLCCVAVVIGGLAFAIGYKIGGYHRVECDCQECSGTGKVEYDGSIPGLPKGVYVCPMCKGGGKLELEPVK